MHGIKDLQSSLSQCSRGVLLQLHVAETPALTNLNVDCKNYILLPEVPVSTTSEDELCPYYCTCCGCIGHIIPAWGPS